MSCRVRAARTCAAVRPSGSGTSTTYRLDRSTSVPIADFPPLPISRSPSQCPGIARSSASLGRSLMRTTLRPLGTQTGRQFLPEGPTGLYKERAVDGFVRDAHTLIVRIVIDE